ncbi:Porin MspD precursor [Mycobacteroides salmoniphilum]|uniref:Porin MspD n=1 Tax=Mycobacteroides salmoniphilum TaxID=404941 RepID=A0A4R8S0B9_9MYCO|nr:Porin MspD precursor [Mycobacteroides salmoniphilum]
MRHLLNGVFPLDRNRLTREWFHSGRAVYEVTVQGSAGGRVTTYGETWDMR